MVCNHQGGNCLCAEVAQFSVSTLMMRAQALQQPPFFQSLGKYVVLKRVMVLCKAADAFLHRILCLPWSPYGMPSFPQTKIHYNHNDVSS